MSEEPELIDIFAMFALNGIISKYKGEDAESSAHTAYEYAHEMMIARERFIRRPNDDSA